MLQEHHCSLITLSVASHVPCWLASTLEFARTADTRGSGANSAGLGITHSSGHNGWCPFEHTFPLRREATHTSYKNSGPYFERPTEAACPLAFFFFCVIYMPRERVCVDEYIRNGSLLLAAEVGSAAGRQGN